MLLLCSEVKERMKKAKNEKATARAADTKKGGKAPKNVQSFQKGAAKNFKR